MIELWTACILRIGWEMKMTRAGGGPDKWGKRSINGFYIFMMSKNLNLEVAEQTNKTQQYHGEERALKMLRIVLPPAQSFFSFASL